MRKEVGAAGLAVLLICGGAAAQNTGTLKQIADRGVITIGYRESVPPMSYRGDDGKPAGYTIDLCQRIAAAVKDKLKRPDIKTNYVQVSATGRFDAVKTGAVDLLCGATTRTLARSEIVDFTQITFVTGASMLSRRDTIIRQVRDLAGRKVAVVRNSTTIDALNRAMSRAGLQAQLVTVESGQDGMVALDAGRVDAVASDQTLLVGLALATKDAPRYFLAPEIFSYEPLAIAVRRNDADFRLVANRVLSRLYRSREILDIYKKWFGGFAPRPSRLLMAAYRINEIPE